MLNVLMAIPNSIKIGGFEIRFYGILIASAVVISILLAIKECKRRGVNADMPIDVALIGIVLGIIGARLYYVAFQWSDYKDNLIRILYINEGGLAIYGALIGALLAALIYSKVKKFNFWLLCDIGIPYVALSQAIGRWGNFFNQEAYGTPVRDTAMQWFPFAVQIERANRLPGFEAYDWFHATFFYESMWCVALFAFLMFWRKRAKFTGEIFAWYLVIYGVGRAWIEGLRTDSLMLSADIRVSQVLSILLAVGSLIAIILLRKRAEKSAEKQSELGELKILLETDTTAKTEERTEAPKAADVKDDKLTDEDWGKKAD